MKASEVELATIKRSNVYKTFVSGITSASLSTLLLQPLEVAKTQLQVNQKLKLCTVYRHVLDNFGARGFWRGTAVSLLRNGGGMSVFFPGLYWLQYSIYGNEKPSPLGSFLVAGTVRSFNCLLFSPLSVVKTRFESGSTKRRGVWTALSTIYRNEGVTKLYAGLVPTIVRDFPHSGLNVMFYWEIKSRMPGHHVLLDSSIAGCLAAFLSCLITHPFDVVKTKMQNSPTRNPTLRYTTRKLWNRKRVISFYLGFIPRTGRKIALSIINWVVLEAIVYMF